MYVHCIDIYIYHTHIFYFLFLHITYICTLYIRYTCLSFIKLTLLLVFTCCMLLGSAVLRQMDLDIHTGTSYHIQQIHHFHQCNNVVSRRPTHSRPLAIHLNCCIHEVHRAHSFHPLLKLQSTNPFSWVGSNTLAMYRATLRTTTTTTVMM